jgi:hypothetical protein
VHAQLTDETGNDVGLASTHYEHVTDGYERLTDAEWTDLLQSGAQPRPAWLPDAFVP